MASVAMVILLVLLGFFLGAAYQADVDEIQAQVKTKAETLAKVDNFRGITREAIDQLRKVEALAKPDPLIAAKRVALEAKLAELEKVDGVSSLGRSQELARQSIHILGRELFGVLFLDASKPIMDSLNVLEKNYEELCGVKIDALASIKPPRDKELAAQYRAIGRKLEAQVAKFSEDIVFGERILYKDIFSLIYRLDDNDYLEIKGVLRKALVHATSTVSARFGRRPHDREGELYSEVFSLWEEYQKVEFQECWLLMRG